MFLYALHYTSTCLITESFTGEEKKNELARFLNSAETFDSPTRKKCVLANTAARGASTSKSIQRYQSSHAISSFAAIENAFTLWFAPSLPRAAATASATRIAFRARFRTIPFVVVSKDETGVTARACETSNWLKTVITERRFGSAHYFGGDVKGTSTWLIERA